MDQLCTLPYEHFKLFAKNLVENSQRLSDGWELRTVPTGVHRNNVYLVKKCTQELAQGENIEPELEEDLFLEELAGEDSMFLKEEDGDIASGHKVTLKCNMPEASQTTTTLIFMEYHVVHSNSYQVPVLYFNTTYSNGKSLSLAETWRLLSISSDVDKWGVVTQQEHPYLGRPFYHVHPCHTAQAMGKARGCLGDVDGNWNYLVSWLSMFGLLVGLHVPLGYAKSN